MLVRFHPEPPVVQRNMDSVMTDPDKANPEAEWIFTATR